MPNWFEELVGFEEENPEQVRAQLQVEKGRLTSLVNGKSYEMGHLEIASLKELRASVERPSKTLNQMREWVGDVQKLHLLPENAGATFQAASQFNLLEMVGPNVRPEQGIGRYERDRTQGPACAIACGAGTIFRNYLVEIDGKRGQEENRQIDTLSAIGAYFNNAEKQYWQMQNGYALATEAGLKAISQQIKALSAEAYDALKALLQVGIQWHTEVTLSDAPRKVTQVYCSALPVAYSSVPAVHWEAFARLVLEATYEATFWAALKNRAETGNPRLFLTLVGGGAFGNKSDWIRDALLKSLKRFENSGLEIYFVSYGASNPLVGEILAASS